MQEMLLTLLDQTSTIHVEAHSGLVDIAIAALSTDPETIDDLQRGMCRYIAQDVVEGLFAGIREGLGDASAYEGMMIIDLPGRVVNTSLKPTEMHQYGSVAWCDHVSTRDVWLPYRFEGWHILHDEQQWQPVAEQRRQERTSAPRLAARKVLYGRVAEYLACQWKERAGSAEHPLAEIQAAWLLTPRDDLHGLTPRELLLSRKAYIDGDIEDVAAIWTILGDPPPGLSTDSDAYRFARFGTHEIVLYHEMVAHLLTELKQRWGDSPDFDVTAEARHLDELREEWLHSPQEELYDLSPAALIARNRARLPWVVPPEHACIDDNCPLCQMMAESNQPMFWHLDGYTLDEHFATSFYDSREDWEVMREEMRIWSSRIPQYTSGNEDVSNESFEGPRIWKSTFTNMDLVRDMPVSSAIGMMVFSIGGHLAELSMDLSASAETEATVCTLQSRFAALRRAVCDESSWTVNLIIAQYAEELQAVAAMHNDLRSKCDDLEKKLDYLGQLCSDHFSKDQPMRT